MSAIDRKPLWATAHRVNRFRNAHANNDPTAVQLIHACKRILDNADNLQNVIKDYDENFDELQNLWAPRCPILDAMVVLTMLHQDTALADEIAKLALDAWYYTPDRKIYDLGLGHYGNKAALILDGAGPYMSADNQRKLATLAQDLSYAVRVVSKGNPHTVANNWWAVSHGGALSGALAAQPYLESDEHPVCPHSEHIAWLAARTSAFAQHFGDGGIYHEGLGYQCYAMLNLLPGLLALKEVQGIDAISGNPGIQYTPQTMLSVVAPRYAWADQSPNKKGSFGSMLSWNDAGQGWGDSNLNAIFAEICPPEHRGAVRWFYDRLVGIESMSPTFCLNWYGLFYSALMYPFDVPACSPEHVFSKTTLDSRQGLAVFRNRYRDHDDSMLGVYARTTHLGGHKQQDVCSLRMMALDHDWIIGGGQARGKAEYQSLFMPKAGVGMDPGANGLIHSYAPHENGGAIGLENRKFNQCYAERYVAVDYSEHYYGVNTLMAIMDMADDHKEREWIWRLLYQPSLKLEMHDDNEGFTLLGKRDTRMTLRFYGSKPRLIEQGETPASARTFAGGNEVKYAGRPFIHLEYDPAEHLCVYAVLAVTRGRIPDITPARDHNPLAMKINGKLWERPFGSLVPTSYIPTQSSTLCHMPHGIPDGPYQPDPFAGLPDRDPARW